MAYTSNKLISGAFYASGIVSREFQTVTGQQVQDGLEWLNELLSRKVVEYDLIPYEGTTTFTGVVGQEEYDIDDLIKADTLTFLKDDVRYHVTERKRDYYKGRTRIQNITSLSFEYNQERQLGGTKISLWFQPDEAYTFTINGVFRLAEISLNQDLDLTLDKFYRSFLQRQLTEKICLEYSEPVPKAVQDDLDAYRAQISKQSRPLDLTLKKRSTLQKRKRTNWAFVNFGTGYTP